MKVSLFRNRVWIASLLIMCALLGPHYWRPADFATRVGLELGCDRYRPVNRVDIFAFAGQTDSKPEYIYGAAAGCAACRRHGS